jgi:hypothetical protein
MDPEETQSEAGGWKSTASIGSMSFMDTRSEPPLSMADKLLLKKLRGGKKTNTVVPVDAPLTNSTKASSLTSSSSTSSVISESRSATTSSKNAFKLDRKLTQASQVSVGGGGTASSSRRSKQSRNSSGVAVVKKAPSLLSSLPTTTSNSTKSSSKKHERSSSVKSNTTKKTWSTVSSKEEQSSSSTPLELALVVPQPVTNDPPTYECYGFHDSTTKGYDNDTNYDSSAYSSSSYDMPKKVIAVIGDEDTQLDTISESDEGTGSGREVVVVRTAKDNNDALVEYEQSTTSQSTNTNDDDAERGALVSAFKSNYLAAAVDNYGAIVPFDSEIYEPYDHTFVSCPEYLRFRFLYTFLKKNLDKKIIIFYSTTESAVFHSKLLSRFNIPKVMMMHGQQKQTKFINTFFKFSDMEDGILCTTDSAGRDLDIPPSVDYVLQFEPPDDPSEYILRIGRVSCDSDRVGRSILFLNPGETNGFLKYYDSASIPVSEFEVPKLLAEIQSNVERLVNNERMLQYAKDAYGAYLLAYASHGFRDVYNVHDLNKDDVASAFGLLSIPGDDEDDDDDDDSTSFYASRSSSSSKRSGTSTQMVANNKSTKKTWMKGNKKTWPHCRVRVHPMFKNDKALFDIDGNEY